MPYGVIVNALSVLFGGLLGALLKNRFPDRLKEVLTSVFGFCSMAMGISFIVKLESLSAVMLSIIAGTLIGELLYLEDHLNNGVRYFECKLKLKLDDKQTDALISMVVLFCFSGTGIFGAMNSGITGDHSVLYAKSILDFFTAMIFAANSGILVAFISIPQFLILLILYLLSTLLMPYLTSYMISNFRASGGIINLAVGFKIAGIKQTKAFNMVPGIFLCFLFSLFL